jgi:phospholipid transport system substrate-binding protein
MAVDSFSSIYSYFVPIYVPIAARATDLLNQRTIFLEEIAQSREEAFDFYVFVRNAYLQNREARLTGELAGSEEPPPDTEEEEDLYYLEDEPTKRAKTMGGRVLLAMALLAALLGAASMTARQIVEGALAEIIVILHQKGKSEEVRRDEIAEIAYQHFDFDTMSMLVIARPWRKFTKEERAEFIAEFKTHLARSYGRRLSRYEGLDVKVVGEVAEQRGDVTVQSVVVGGQFDGATINYRMREKSGTWLVIDVVIEGVSLVSNFRSQFKPIVAEGGAPELLKRLKEKNHILVTDPDSVEEGI